MNGKVISKNINFRWSESIKGPTGDKMRSGNFFWAFARNHIHTNNMTVRIWKEKWKIDKMRDRMETESISLVGQLILLLFTTVYTSLPIYRFETFIFIDICHFCVYVGERLLNEVSTAQNGINTVLASSISSVFTLTHSPKKAFRLVSLPFWIHRKYIPKL